MRFTISPDLFLFAPNEDIQNESIETIGVIGSKASNYFIVVSEILVSFTDLSDRIQHTICKVLSETDIASPNGT